MNSPFMGRESEHGHGLPSRPWVHAAGAGAVQWRGRCVPFASMGEAFGKSVLSFRARVRAAS